MTTIYVTDIIDDFDRDNEAVIEMIQHIVDVEKKRSDSWHYLHVDFIVHFDESNKCLLLVHSKTGNILTVETCRKNLQFFRNAEDKLWKKQAWVLGGDTNDEKFMEQFWAMRLDGPMEPFYNMLKQSGQLLMGRDAADIVLVDARERMEEMIEARRQMYVWTYLLVASTPGSLEKAASTPGSLKKDAEAAAISSNKTQSKKKNNNGKKGNGKKGNGKK